jgi:uncharacterized protein (DUF302 family)
VAPEAEGVVTVPSPYPVDDTLARLEAAILDRGMTLFAQVDHAAGAAGAGLEMNPARVLIFGSPAAGTPLMVASPLLALDLPLRALVWQDDAGAVWVSHTSPESLAVRYALPDDLVANIAGVERLVATALA